MPMTVRQGTEIFPFAWKFRFTQALGKFGFSGL